MKKVNLKKMFTVLVSFVLIAVIALTMSACTGNTDDSNTTTASPVTEAQQSESVEKVSLGEGETQFPFNVTHKDGSVKEILINTNKETVGDALVELNVIAGEDSEYGLYVKTVDGETLDYDADQMYWAFYVDGAYAQTGVDQTNITAGATYEFKAEK